MLSAPTIDLTADDDDEWVAGPAPARLYRAASVGNSWGVTSMGRGFVWEKRSDEADPPRNEEDSLHPPKLGRSKSDRDADPLAASKRWNRLSQNSVKSTPPITTITPPSPRPPEISVLTESISDEPVSFTSDQSRPASPRPLTPGGVHSSSSAQRYPPSGSRSPTSPRPRRRSSQQRVSLVAGRVLIAPMEPPASSVMIPIPPSIHRIGNAPLHSGQSFLGERNISEFSIEKEIGRGAYGLVKLAREIQTHGSLGPPLVIKQVIKSRILADCWKRHPKYGTIPTEIYVMSALSAITYELPARRPWDPVRFSQSTLAQDQDDAQSADTLACNASWVKGKVVKGHPNICPLLDFFEDDHYYYLVLPSTIPKQLPDEPPPASDLFDLVETFPQGLQPSSIRSYLGQLADALCFLHSRGIVHRDVKDENVILGPSGKCILIDFGSSGLVKSGGWDTFSGTLDYAGPEILRGERYHGKEQDVWAFGVVAYVLLVGECPFTTADEAQVGLESPFASATIALDERCADDKEKEGEELDGGGTLGDAAALVRACLQVEVSARPTFEKILQCRFLGGHGGWT